MSSDKCPWCGDELMVGCLRTFRCGSLLFSIPPGRIQSVTCKDRELTQQRQRADDAERRLAEFTADAARYIKSDDAIGEVCLAAGFDCESTLEAVQAMAAKLAEVTAERDSLAIRVKSRWNEIIGWVVVEESPDGSLLLESSTGNRKRIWRGDGKAERELAALKATIAAAPVYRMFTSDAGDVFIWGDEAWRGGTRVRLLPEPEVSDGAD